MAVGVAKDASKLHAPLPCVCYHPRSGPGRCQFRLPISVVCVGMCTGQAGFFQSPVCN